MYLHLYLKKIYILNKIFLIYVLLLDKFNNFADIIQTN
jgi:hypothetical protein